MSTGAVFSAHEKRITERNSHLAGEASGSSISNGCQTKTDSRRQLAGMGTGREGTKLHASVAGSRVTAFLTTTTPWEPYFMDNLRTSPMQQSRLKTNSRLGNQGISTLYGTRSSITQSQGPAILANKSRLHCSIVILQVLFLSSFPYYEK
jgi:hypothetical protein